MSADGGVGPRPDAVPQSRSGPLPTASSSGRGTQTLRAPSAAGLGVCAPQVSTSFCCSPGHLASAPRAQPSGRPVGPTSSQSRGGPSEMYSDFSAEEDDDYSEVDNEYFQEPADETLPSFEESLALLQHLRPSLFSRAEATPARPMSAIASAIARASAPTPVPSSSLLESSHVTSAVQEALEIVRGSKETSTSNLQEFPSGFKCSKYLRPRPLSRSFKLGSKKLVCRSALPDSVPPTNQEDLLIASAGAHPASLTDKNLADNEEFVRRALDACTVLDSFVSGLVESIKVEDPATHQSGSLDVRSINAFAGVIDSSLRFATDALAKVLVNTVLARRDALLSTSATVTTPLARSTLRLAPLSSSSLFDGRVQPLLHQQAEVRRDLAFSLPQSRPSAPPRKRPAFRPPAAPRPKAPRYGPSSYPPPAPYPSQPRRRGPPQKPPARRPQPPRSGPAGRGQPQ